MRPQYGMLMLFFSLTSLASIACTAMRPELGDRRTATDTRKEAITKKRYLQEGTTSLLSVAENQSKQLLKFVSITFSQRISRFSIL
jgi:hypothetical protein